MLLVGEYQKNDTMKKITTILAIIILIFTQSCKKKDDCEDISCFTPPNPFRFELVDKLTRENLFTNGTFNSSDIKVINLADQSAVEFRFIDENDYNIIQINTIGWKTEIVNYSIQISTVNIFNLYVNAERLDEDCCSFTRYKEIKIENSDFEINQTNGIYKILVD
jgi:hypothetical protein